MIKAFVFGKFFPFHKGHEAMINYALTKCDFLSVLICCSDKESISGSIRRDWIVQSFEKVKSIEILTFDYLESEFPNTSESSLEVSWIWSKKFKELFPDCNLLITSEEYGNYVATYMNIEHLSFDASRQFFSVSSSLVRKDLFSFWSFLPDSVKRSFALKVVLLGTESTGKTTLTRRLAEFFNCSWVAETAREIIENSNSFSREDLKHVAIEHAKRIEEQEVGNSPLIIIDTDMHITMSYSRFVFGSELELSERIRCANNANLYFYLNNDAEFIQDGTRLDEEYRNLLDRSHRQTLKDSSIECIELTGNWDARFDKACDEIRNLIIIQSKSFQ